jgi:DNA-directed RNA polymerase specialized sigma24 family protein
MSYQDIAKTLGISVEAVKSRLFRARTYLKQLLQPYLKEDV